MTNIFVTPANFNRPLYQSQDFIQTLNIFPYYLSYLLLIQHKNFNFKDFFYFQKSVKGGPLTNIFATPANFNRPLYQSQAFIRTLNIFPYYLIYLLFMQHKNLNFKDIFYFQKSLKGGPLTNIFATPANFNRPLYQSQDLIRTLNIFPYYLSSLLLIRPKNFNFKAHFLFSKKCKEVPLTKTFPTCLLYTSPSPRDS